jgi:hypothetical protein
LRATRLSNEDPVAKREVKGAGSASNPPRTTTVNSDCFWVSTIRTDGFPDFMETASHGLGEEVGGVPFAKFAYHQID